MKVIFKLFMQFVVWIANFFLAPINALVVNFVPDLTEKINLLESIVNRFFTPTLSWFFNLLPPHTKSIVIFYLGLLIVLFTITIGVHAVLKVIHLIKNIKFW